MLHGSPRHSHLHSASAEHSSALAHGPPINVPLVRSLLFGGTSMTFTAAAAQLDGTYTAYEGGLAPSSKVGGLHPSYHVASGALIYTARGSRAPFTCTVTLDLTPAPHTHARITIMYTYTGCACRVEASCKQSTHCVTSTWSHCAVAAVSVLARQTGLSHLLRLLPTTYIHVNILCTHYHAHIYTQYMCAHAHAHDRDAHHSFNSCSRGHGFRSKRRRKSTSGAFFSASGELHRGWGQSQRKLWGCMAVPHVCTIATESLKSRLAVVRRRSHCRVHVVVCHSMVRDACTL